MMISFVDVYNCTWLNHQVYNCVREGVLYIYICILREFVFIFCVIDYSVEVFSSLD